MADPEQLPLFDKEPEPQRVDPPGDVPGLSARTPLDQAMVIYMEALRFSGASPHTLKAFRSDLNLLARWSGARRSIGQYSTHDLNQFLHWMLYERDKPCSPKTYARRVTALKNFFGYLYEVRAIPRDPSNAVIQRTVSSPLPDVLLPPERERALAVTERLRRDPRRPDARPCLLLTLLLETGIKKSEVMALHPQDVERDHPEGPRLWIRYANPQMRYKERKLPISPAWLDTLAEYLDQRKPKAEIFDCTPRNLEYVLRDVAVTAGIEPSRLSFETLRWTCALRDYLSGMDHDRLRQKLGISRVTWATTGDKLAELARLYGEAGSGSAAG